MLILSSWDKRTVYARPETVDVLARQSEPLEGKRRGTGGIEDEDEDDGWRAVAASFFRRSARSGARATSLLRLVSTLA